MTTMSTDTDFTPTPNPFATDRAVANSTRSALVSLTQTCTIAYTTDLQAVVSFAGASHRALASALSGIVADEQTAWYLLAWELANTVREMVEGSGRTLAAEAVPEDCQCGLSHEADTRRINGFLDAAVGGDYRKALRFVKEAQNDLTNASALERAIEDEHDLRVREIGIMLLRVNLHVTQNILMWAHAEASDPEPTWRDGLTLEEQDDIRVSETEAATDRDPE
jgi:hypothetical protein